MAKESVYSFYDNKAKFYGKPMFFRNDGEATRSWEGAANDEKSTISAHPSDFELFRIGEFDDQTGSIIPAEAKVSLGLAVHYKKSPQSPATLFNKEN